MDYMISNTVIFLNNWCDFISTLSTRGYFVT